MKKIFILSLCFSLLPSLALATPSISGVSGTSTQGQSVTISGSGFGTKAQVAPQLFDRVENTWPSLSNGDAIPTDTYPWDGYSQSYYGTLNQRNNFSIANYYNINSVKNMVQGFSLASSVDKVYISWWFKSSLSDTGGKFIRFSDGTQFTVAHQFVWANGGNYLYDEGRGTQGGYCAFNNDYYHWNYGTNWYGTTPSANTWHFYEVLIDNINNTWQVFLDNADHSNGLTTWENSCTLTLNEVSILGLDAGGVSPPSQTSYLDDIYIDNSWSRLEVCSGSTWSSRTRCEIQIPTTWSTNSITFTANQGSFTNGQQAYIYVVDSDGNVNADGYSITIGGGTFDTTPPAAPMGVVVQ
jgi:hypothetical protein